MAVEESGIETVGAVEILNQLVFAYTKTGQRPTPTYLWSEIVRYMKLSDERVFRWYRMRDWENSQKPIPQFLGDLGDLIRTGHIKHLIDGTLELTSFGRFLASARVLPPEYRDLARDIERGESVVQVNSNQPA